MRFALPVVCLAALLAAGSRSVFAGPALDDDKSKRPSSTEEPPASATPDVTEVEYGVGVRLRSVFVPKPILELFVTRAAGGAQNYDLGDTTRANPARKFVASRPGFAAVEVADGSLTVRFVGIGPAGGGGSREKPQPLVLYEYVRRR